MPKILSNGDHLYDDSNIDELLVEAAHHPRGLLPRREHPFFAPYGSCPALRKYEDVMPGVIPRSDWSDLIKEQERTQSRVSDHIIMPPKLQTKNYCWAMAVANAANIAMRIANVPGIDFSATSMAAIITNYRNIGGWGIDAVNFAAETGACSTDLWPENAIDRQYDTPESRADRANHHIIEWVDVPISRFDELATCLLQPAPCPGGYSFMSHEVCVCDLVEIEPGDFGVRYWNSWGKWGSANKHGIYGFAVLRGSQKLPDDCQMLRQCTPSAA